MGVQWRVWANQNNDCSLNIIFKSGHVGYPACPHILNSMRREYIFFYFQFFVVCAVCGQGNTFNMTRLFSYPQTEFTHMILHDDAIVVYGVGFNNDITWKQGVAVMKLDTFGNVISDNFILDSKGDLLATDKAWGNIIRTSDGGYAAIAATVYRKSAFLIKLSNDLQVEFIREYPDTVNLSNYFYKIIEVPDGYLLYGAIQRPDYYNDGFIRYVDRQGETIWFKYFEFSNFSTSVVDVKILKDSTYIASFATSTNAQQNIGFSSFMIFDLNGMNLYLRHFPVESSIGANREIIVTSKGSILAFGLCKVRVVNNIPIYQPALVGLNDYLIPIWERHFGRPSTLNASVLLWDFVATLDSHYVGVGETLLDYGDDLTRRVGWLYKFSADGDSIWERKIDVPFPPPYTNKSGFLSGVGVLSSGNIIAAGSAREGNKQYCWLVKLTNDGCLDTLFCQPVSSTIALPQNQMSLDVFPNPASGHFNIESSISIKQITVFDALGHLIFQRQHLGVSARVELPAHLPAGWYVVLLQDESGNSAYRKIYVQP